MNPYYLVVEEWDYPTESGREPCEFTYDKLEDAIKRCYELAVAEALNFSDNVRQDYLPPERCGDGVLITTKMGIDPLYYYARVITVGPVDCTKPSNTTA